MDPERTRRAVRLSFWLPGLGQLYLRRPWSGGSLLAMGWVAGDLAWRQCSAGWLAGALAVWLVAVRDAGRPRSDG